MKTDLLDDLKKVWNEPPKEHVSSDDFLHQKLASLWQKRSRSTKRKVLFELGSYLVIYAGAIVVMVQASTDAARQWFALKVILLSLIFFAPVCMALYQSIVFLRQADLTQPMGLFVEASIRQLRKAERLYLRYSYLFSGFMVVLLATDELFNRQALWLRATVFVFIVLFALAVQPYVRWTYGKDRRYFEALKNEMEENR